MGTWGSGLYANDTTCDVKDTYIHFLQDGLDDMAAYDETRKACREYKGTEEEPLVWYALAETQWRTGRLLPEVKETALRWIAEQGGLSLWEESANKGAGWKKTLQNLQKKLESPMPARKTVKKPDPIIQDYWALNDVYAYQFHEKISIERGCYGKYMLLQKIGVYQNRYDGQLSMRIQVLDGIFDSLPAIDVIMDMRIVPLDFPTRVNISRDAFNSSGYLIKKDPIWMSSTIFAFSKRDYPKKYLTFIGNRPGPLNQMVNRQELDWGNIDDWLYEFYQYWRNIQYDTLGNGIYDYAQPLE